MSDLISRQALSDAMYHEAFETDTDMQQWNSGCWIRYKLFENVLRNTPSADAIEEQPGNWTLDIDDSFPLLRRGWRCSKCGDRQTYGITPYCPYCGSRMEEKI